MSLGVRRIVAGSIGTRGKRYLFNLNLDNVETGKVENRVFRLVEGGVEDLIRAVQEGDRRAVPPARRPGKIQIASMPAGARVSIDNAYLGVTPLISGTLLAGKHNVRVEADGRFPWMSKVEVLHAGAADQAHLRQPAGATPLAGLHGLRLGLGVRSRARDRWFPGRAVPIQPTGNDRAAAQNDEHQKVNFARGANIAFGAGAFFAVVSLYHYVTATIFLAAPRSTTNRRRSFRPAIVTVRRTA